MTSERTLDGAGNATRFLVALTLVCAGVALPARAGRAEDDSKAAGPPTRAELLKLQAEVREQRQLIIQMLQSEQQRYDMLLRLIQTQSGGGLVAPAPAPSSAAEAPSVEPEASGGDAEAAPKKEGRVARAAGAATERKTGFVEGKVSLTGSEGGDVYVYLDGVRGAPVRGKSIEIKQEGKQFRPRVAVVQAGTSVTFPNLDKIYHNVFSNSPRNSFDLGSHSADEKPRPVTLASPGVVEVFCNMHQKMNANILVVPNGLYTKVRPDGTFRLDNLPVGSRWLAAWSPQSKPVRRRIDVIPSGAQVSFVLEHEEPRAHTNKLGQAYGSYRE
jgi:plastocyanin